MTQWPIRPQKSIIQHGRTHHRISSSTCISPASSLKQISDENDCVCRKRIHFTIYFRLTWARHMKLHVVYTTHLWTSDRWATNDMHSIGVPPPEWTKNGSEPDPYCEMCKPAMHLRGFCFQHSIVVYVFTYYLGADDIHFWGLSSLLLEGKW